MFLSISALVFQLAASALSFRMTTHPEKRSASRRSKFWVYLVFAFAGVLATVGSIVATNRANETAQKTIRTIEAQLAEARRPSLTPERLSMIKYGDGKLGIAMEVDNRGGGTAYKAHIFTIVSDVGATETKPDLAYSESEARGISDIPTQSAMAFRLDSGIGPSDLRKYLGRGDRIFFLGSLWWEDGAGAKQERAFCFLYRKDGLFESRKPRTCEA